VTVDRARCAVPFCRRTASTEAGYVDQRFLCGPHWRLRSPALREEWRRLARLRRRSPGPWTEHKGAARLVRLALDREEEALWERTRAHCIEIALGVTG
jgi:hypothetical protein